MDEKQKKKKCLQTSSNIILLSANDIAVTAGPERDWTRQGWSPCDTAARASRQQREGGWGRKKERTDVCDLCLAPWGIPATDNLIEAAA